MDESNLFQLWVYLSASPLLWLSITLCVYLLSSWAYQRSGMHPLCNPVAWSIALLIVILKVTDTPYGVYFEGAQFVHFLLGPATVALAIPLYNQIAKLRAIWLPVAVAICLGVTAGAFSAMLLAKLFGGSLQTLLSLAPKSVTTPVAMGISEKIGGLPALTAAMVVSAGIVGAVAGPKLLDWMGLKDDSLKGVAMGVSAHGIGTARAFQISTEMGAFSGLAMALSALVASISLPWLLSITASLWQ